MELIYISICNIHYKSIYEALNVALELKINTLKDI